MTPVLHLTGEAKANQLLAENPLALVIGMLLDQQIPMEVAFAGPHKIHERLGKIDAQHIAAYDPEEFAALCSTPPAVHRFPGSMAKRIQTLCQLVLDEYDGKVEALWTTGKPDGPEVIRRLTALPGFGEAKARIFLALLGKQMGVTPKGWRDASGGYGEKGTYRSVADVVDDTSLAEVRAHKKAAKAAAKKSS